MRKFKTTHLIAAICVMFFASCSTEQAVFNAPEDVSERIDMVIDGNNTEHIFIQSTDANDNPDLVHYNFYGTGTHQFDIRLNIGNGRTLVFKLANETATDLWEVEEGYSLYASRDLEDKQKHVSIEMHLDNDVFTHSSHVGDVFPKGTHVNVFRIVDFDPANSEILCRITDLPLLNLDNSNEIVTINGTFRGAVDFLN